VTAYATRADLYNYGLPRANLGSGSREVASADFATNTLEIDQHGYETCDAVTFRPCEGGALPAGIARDQEYFAIRISHSHLKVSATVGGAEANFTTAGNGFFIASPLPFDAVIEFYSRWVDHFLVGHRVPLVAPDAFIVGIVAELSARKLMLLAGHKSESVTEYELAAKAQVERFAKGITVKSDSAHTNLSVVASAKQSDRRFET
jgi:hypothetical protein